MDFVDEKDVAFLQVSERAAMSPALFNCRTGGGAEFPPLSFGDDVRQRSFYLNPAGPLGEHDRRFLTA